MLVQAGSSQCIEEVVPRVLVFHEVLKVLEHKLLHRHVILITDGILPQEVQLYHMLLAICGRVQSDVLHSERTAAHGVGRLTLFLLISCSQCQLINKIKGYSQLPFLHFW